MSGEMSEPTSKLADSVLDRMSKTKEEVAIEDSPFVKVQRGEMFELTTRELAAVLQKNPNHPVAASYRKAVSKNPPDEKLTIEKIDLQALLENKEVTLTQEVGETEVEGVKMRTATTTKKLGQQLKPSNAAVPQAGDFTPNQPNAPQTNPRHKLGGDIPKP